jgi:hypothetical protein
MALAPALGLVGGVRTGLLTAVHRAEGTTVHDRSRPINLVVACEPIQKRKMDQIPHARLLAVARDASTSSPTRTRVPAAAWDATPEDKHDPGETRAIADARAPAFRPTGWSWQERFDQIPQRNLKQRSGPTRSRYLAEEVQLSEVLLRALSDRGNCDRTVIRSRQNLDEHRGLRTHTE